MKKSILSLMSFVIFIGLSPLARADVREIAVGVSDALVPRTRAGQETNVILNGVFPNGCYRWSRATVNHLPGNLHEVRSFALVQSGMCIMVLVPFTKEISVGRLTPGLHRFRFINGDGTYMEKQATIE